MSFNPFSLSNIGLLLITAALVCYLFILWQKAKHSATAIGDSAYQNPVKRFAIIYGSYFLLLCVLAGTNFFTVITMPPRFVLIFLPMLLVVVLLSRASIDGSLQFLSMIPPVLLIGVQTMRILIELLFLQFEKEGLIPTELSFHGRNYDLLIGVLAIPVSLLFFRKHRLAKKAGVAFNILGLASLVNIFTIAIPSLPSTFRVYDTLYLPTYFPGVLIVFLASWALFLHVLSLRQLLAKKTENRPAKNSKSIGKKEPQLV